MGGVVMIWAARLVGLALAAFLGLMALDTPIGLGLLIHLIPCFIVLILVAIGWRLSRLGGWLFLAAGVAATLFFNTYRHLLNFLIISGPFFLTGLLLLLHRRR